MIPDEEDEIICVSIPDAVPGAVGGRAAEDDDDPVGCRSPMEALTAFNESSLLLKVLDLDLERSLAVPVASEAEVGALKLLTPESGDNRCWPETKKNTY